MSGKKKVGDFCCVIFSQARFARILLLSPFGLPAHVLGWGHAKFFLEVLGEDFGRVVSQLIGNLGHLQLAFGQKLLGALHADESDELEGGFARNLDDLFVEVSA